MNPKFFILGNMFNNDFVPEDFKIEQFSENNLTVYFYYGASMRVIATEKTKEGLEFKCSVDYGSEYGI